MSLLPFLHNFSIISQLLICLGSLFITFVAYLTYKMIVRPLVRMQYYKKQGIYCDFFPLLGSFKKSIDSLNNHDDFKHHIKNMPTEFPQPIVCSNLGSNVSLTPFDPAILKEYFMNGDRYVKDPTFIELYQPLLGKGLIISEGTHWKSRRKVISTVFHFEFLKSALPGIQEATVENFELLKKTGLKNVNIMDVFQDITGEVVGRIFFGEVLTKYTMNGKSLTKNLGELIAEIGLLNVSAEKNILGAWIIKQGIFPKHKKLMNKIKDFRSVSHAIINDRKAQRAQNIKPKDKQFKDLLDTLLDYEGEEGKMDDDEIIDQFVTFFLAGMDTTGHFVTIVTYYLIQHPEHKKKMMDELKEHYKGPKTTMEDLNKLDFTTAFLKETLRVASPAPGMFPRIAIKDHKLGKYNVRKGDLITFDFIYPCYDPKYFSEPFDFKPERWLNKDIQVETFAFTPFSAGPRNCIGQHLSMNESKIILAEFLNTFDFELIEGYKLKMSMIFLYGPLNPILLNLKAK